MGANTPVINLKNLNKVLSYQHFRMEGLHGLKFLLQNGACAKSIEKMHISMCR